MKTKISLLILILTITFSCQEEIKEPSNSEKTANTKEGEDINFTDKKVIQKDNFEIPDIKVRATTLPIKLELIDFEDEEKTLSVSDGKVRGIENAIRDYYVNDCGGDSESYYSMKDVYLNTIQLSPPSNLILYWVIFNHVSGKVNSKILFFDNTKKEFLDYKHNFNIHALYNEVDRKLESTNLKKGLQLDFPEIEIIDFDGDKYEDFKLTRLYHNGTENAIEKMVIELNGEKVDTLEFEKEWIRN